MTNPGIILAAQKYTKNIFFIHKKMIYKRFVNHPGLLFLGYQ